MSAQQRFLAEVEEFLVQQKMLPAQFGIAALNDPSFVFDLREGRSPRLDTVEKVRDFMRAAANGEAAA